MTEILTESFCERCGTRYTFESVAPKQKRMGGIRTLGRGLRNFVLSDDSSLDEAMAEARSDVEREATAQQLDAFHRTFNFCMSCRQYTCGNCWNGVEARCLSCAPLPEAEIVAAAAFAAPPADFDLDLDRLMRLTAPPSATETEPESEAAWPVEAAPDGASPGESEAPPDGAWPSEAEAVATEPEAVAATPELGGELEARALADAEAVAPETEAPAADWTPVEPAAPVAADGVETGALPAWATLKPAEPPIADEVEAEVEVEAGAPPADEVAEVAAPARASLQGLVPGESLDDVIAAYEAAQAKAAEAVALEAEASEAAALEAAKARADELRVEDARAAEAALAEAQAARAEAEAVLAEAHAARAAAEAALAEAERARAASAVVGPGPGIDVVEQPTWPSTPAPTEPTVPVAEPEAAAPTSEPEVEVEAPPPMPAPAIPTAAPPAPSAPSGPPQWPTGPRWPTGMSARPMVGPPPAGVPADDRLTAIMARQATEAMWAESSRDVTQPPLVAQQAPIAGVQPCINCGISLSATARFCRRCGTSQAG